ncbi:transmembrane protein 17B-like isoform X3 [Oxyura jamaicensis]|uniref:transmembrane protein 17B-like isoform X3 n=1 Tax=Oxyura jamaicensis TaxID=8884 RepID=UPI0015A678C4|nr:transmembrane protein 17B-like isoform X3 [Oxyura jamaicensis]
MAAQTPLPLNLRRGLTAFSSSLFINNKTWDSGAAHIYRPAHEVLASLPLQMMLYFNACYFPFWCLGEGMMLQLKYSLLPRYYQLLLLAAFLILTLTEGARLYLGYIGNLQEKVRLPSPMRSWKGNPGAVFPPEGGTHPIKGIHIPPQQPLPKQVPELAGFLLLSFLIQLPLLLFLLTDDHIIRLPLEMAVHSLFLAFLISEVVAAFLALRVMTTQLAAQFYLQQFTSGGRGRSLTKGDDMGPVPPWSQFL